MGNKFLIFEIEHKPEHKNHFVKMPRGGGTAGGGKRGGHINFHKPSDPSFLKAFKEKVGYKEKVTTIDDKFPSTTEAGRAVAEFEDREDRDDEKPVVVVLGDGDLTAAEAETEMKAQDDAPPPPGTKIMFKKPTKRTSKDTN